MHAYQNSGVYGPGYSRCGMYGVVLITETGTCVVSSVPCVSGSETRLAGKLVFLSGRTGKVLSWSWVPDGKESYYSPIVYTRHDGSTVVLFGTGRQHGIVGNRTVFAKKRGFLRLCYLLA